MKFQLLFSILFFSTFSLSQNPQWINYTSGKLVNCVIYEDQYLWAGTYGGLVKINTLTQEKIYYDRGNSGLPDNIIRSMAIDSSGNKWIGTDAGVTVFNGTSFITYDTSSNFIPGNSINKVYSAGNNTVYICTNKGLIETNGSSWYTIDTSNSELPDNIVFTICEDNENNLWIGTKNGLAMKDQNIWTIYNTSNSLLQGNKIRSIAVDQDGYIWVGLKSTGGLYSFNGTDWTDWGTVYSELNNEITTINVGGDNRKWMGTPHEGVIVLDDEDITIYDYGSGIPSVYINDITENNLGIVYIASGFGGGLLMFKENNWTIIGTSKSGFDSYFNDIRCVHVSPNNNINIGINLHGISMFDKTIWTDFNIYDHFNSICTDNEGTTWVGANEGLYNIINGSVSNLSNNGVLSITVDDNNTLWYGGLEGFFMRGDEGFNWFNPSNSGILPGIYTDVDIDRNNIKWIACLFSGLSSFDGENWETFTMSNSDIPFETIWTVATDTNNIVWIGGWGIASYDGTEWQHYNKDNSEIPSNYVNNIAIDKTNVLWIGTDNGMASFDGVNWETFTVKNSGIPFNTVKQIEIDSHNNKWIATQRGLGVYNNEGVTLNVYNKSISNKNKFWVSPNPAGSFFTIHNNSLKSSIIKNVLIYSASGKLVSKLINISLGDRISTSGLNSGIYLIELQGEQPLGFAKILINQY
jgi:ligand-binding sensor domain-containing protein